jgi:hypothetical protein
MAKVFVTRKIPEDALKALREAPEVAEVRVNPDNRVLTRQGAYLPIFLAVFNNIW